MLDGLPVSSATPEPQPARSRRWTVKKILLRVLFWYLVIAAVLALFQRHLIYVPTRAERITTDESGLDSGVVHDILLPTEDGLTLHGWHFLAAGRACRTRAECDEELRRGRLLVLFFHGNGGDRRGRVLDSLIFAGEGADVFLIDYRGYGDNPGSPSEAGLAADARALWKYATEERGVPPERIVLYGESLGGGVAVRLCADLCRDGTPPAGLIVRSTFSSLCDTAAHHFPWLPARLLLLDRFASVDCVGSITCPNLHIHGARDQIVPLALGRRLFEAAPARSAGGIPKRFIELPAADHNDVLFVAREELVEGISGFLASLREPRSSSKARRWQAAGTAPQSCPPAQTGRISNPSYRDGPRYTSSHSAIRSKASSGSECPWR